ncbi:MAG: EamA family transporter [Cyanobacteria bacterium J06642_11]
MGESGGQGANEPLLQSLDDDFQALQRHFADQLAQDIEYLQTEKQRLIAELEGLRGQYDQLYVDYQSLKNEADTTLSDRQLAQQNAWAKRLAQVLAQNLREDLHAYVRNSVDLPSPTQDWLHSLDDTLNRSVKALQQDLSSYQSAISQQLIRMQAMEHQGEVILENLVDRLSDQLGTQLSRSVDTSGVPRALDNRPLSDGGAVVGGRTYVERPRPDQFTGTTRRVVPAYPGRTLNPADMAGGAVAAPSLTRIPKSDRDRNPERALKKGMLLCLVATLGFSVMTVLVGGIALGGELFGQVIPSLGSLNFFQANALVWLHLVVLIPALAILAPQLHRSVWLDINQSLRAPSRLSALLGGGVFYFFSQVLLFQAAGTLGPSVAASLLFAYPLVVVPLLWWLNGDRPNLLRWVVMLAMTMGSVLMLRPLGVSTAATIMLSAVAFGLYVVTNSLSRQLHPVSVGIVQYGVTAILSTLVLLVHLGSVMPSLNSQFVLGGLMLGLVASISYLFHYTGLRLVGGLRTATVAAATPLVTAVLAALFLRTQPTLQLIQWPGVLLITLGGMTLSLDRLSRNTKSA